MNKDLLAITNNFASVMKSCNGVLGAWNFDSVLHGMFLPKKDKIIMPEI